MSFFYPNYKCPKCNEQVVAIVRGIKAVFVCDNCDFSKEMFINHCTSFPQATIGKEKIPYTEVEYENN